jgi:hypothetical protein
LYIAWMTIRSSRNISYRVFSLKISNYTMIRQVLEPIISCVEDMCVTTTPDRCVKRVYCSNISLAKWNFGYYTSKKYVSWREK